MKIVRLPIAVVVLMSLGVTDRVLAQEPRDINQSLRAPEPANVQGVLDQLINRIRRNPGADMVFASPAELRGFLSSSRTTITESISDRGSQTQSQGSEVLRIIGGIENNLAATSNVITADAVGRLAKETSLLFAFIVFEGPRPPLVLPAPQAPSKVAPAPQAPSKVAPAPQAPSKVAPAPQLPGKGLPMPKAPSKVMPYTSPQA